MQVHYYAGAADAAGCHVEDVAGGVTVEGLLASLGEGRPLLADVLTRCSVLVDGRQPDAADELGDDARIDVLPPFAGG